MQKLGRKSPSGISNCEIQELGPRIGRMSRLRQLILSGMKKLVSLPQLPYSLLELDAFCCESLERLDCSFPNPDIRRLDFTYCIKLNKEARDLIIQTPTTEFAVLPGREVPVCFPYRSSGSSITVKLNQMPLGSSTKFKVCIVFAGEDEKDTSSRLLRGGYVYYSITSKQNALGEFYKDLGPVLGKHLYIFEVEAVEVTSTKLAFEFGYGPRKGMFSLESKYDPREIKECGVLQLLEVP
ncbi:unnamed protein product [Thlaspi arvense]|uniref:C-JID domain-containing protein n=1 Tax=Thlaspi arvense TaxID=13288 RepID=A0AAU9RXF7_THLAR|nr:unnamed protein product [Thlaspi arvense]